MDDPDDIEIRSPSGRLSARVSPRRGGRLAALRFDGLPVIVEGTGDDDPLAWGCYPMVPYCGRVRDAVLRVDDRTCTLPRNAPPHAIHGTVHDSVWTIARTTDTSVTLNTDLGATWPFRGHVEHLLTLTDHSLHMQLTLRAEDEMPWMIGWHPWFVKPDQSPVDVGPMFRRDEYGIATAELVERPAGPVDDCFVAREAILTMRVGSVSVALSSDCECWVIYDEPAHATCVEPQSGPPNQVNDDPRRASRGSMVGRWFRIDLALV